MHRELADGVKWDFLHCILLVLCRNAAEFPERGRDSPYKGKGLEIELTINHAYSISSIQSLSRVQLFETP